MNSIDDHRSRRTRPLTILMDCPFPSCTGRVELRATRRSEAVGVCPVCGGSASLRNGVLLASEGQGHGAQPQRAHQEEQL